MRTTSRSIVTALALAAVASAQSAILPPAVANGLEGSSSTGTLWSATANGVRQQMIYARSSLPQGRLTITRMRWRANGGQTTPTTGGTWNNVDIKLATSVNPVGSVATQFASNVGPDVTTVYTGTVGVGVTTNEYPGTFYVDVTFTTPFVYTGTGDLLVDVTLPTGGWIGGTVVTTDYHIPTGTPASRVFSTNPLSATGSVNNGAGIVCEIHYAVDPASALSATTGIGCYDSLAYELFSAASSFDLSGTALRLQPNGAGGYDVAAVPLTFVAPTSLPLTMASGSLDDGVTAPLTMPFPFNFPGGSTTDVRMVTNGFVWLDPTQTSSDLSPSASEFTTLAPRLAIAWTDWNANPVSTSGGGTLHFDVDPSNLAVYLTWNGIAAFGWTAVYGGPAFSTFQCALFADGAIEYRWQSVANPYPLRDMLIGIKPGAGAQPDPGQVDVSAELPLTLVGGSVARLTLAQPAPAVVGTTLSFDTSNIPATAVLTGTLLNVASAPGNDLAGFGMPGCRQYVSLAGAVTLGVAFTNPTASMPLAIPNNLSLVGLPVHAQSVSFVPGVNPLGGLTSNGASVQVGAF